VVRGAGDRAIATLNFWLSKNCQRSFFVVENFLSKQNKNLGVKTPILRKFKGKIKRWSTPDLFCRKFATVCPKIATFCSGYFFQPMTPLCMMQRCPNVVLTQ